MRIHIFGASGAGTTALGVALSQSLEVLHLDCDDFYWLKTDLPFTQKRDPNERVQMIRARIDGLSSWVLSGSLCGWGDPLMNSFDLAVFVTLDPAIRIDRLVKRERQRFGARIDEGGDMRQLHLDFIAWAKSYETAKDPIRSVDRHEKWLRRLTCPVMRLDSKPPVAVLVDQVRRFSADRLC